MDLESFDYVLCQGQEEESLLPHLLIGCPFVVVCWESILLSVDHELSPSENLEWFELR